MCFTYLSATSTMVVRKRLNVRLQYSVIQKDRLKYTWYMKDVHNIWKGSSYTFKYRHQRAHLVHSFAAASVENKMATMQHKNFCVSQRRTRDEFKRVLSVAHATQPVERTQSLEYRNQLSGVCWGAVYCSNESNFDHPVHWLSFSICTIGNTGFFP